MSGLLNLVIWSYTHWPCDCGFVRSPSQERTSRIKFESSISLQLFSLDLAMAADATHGPTPKGALCNAGAGAAAGKILRNK